MALVNYWIPAYLFSFSHCLYLRARQLRYNLFQDILCSNIVKIERSAVCTLALCADLAATCARHHGKTPASGFSTSNRQCVGKTSKAAPPVPPAAAVLEVGPSAADKLVDRKCCATSPTRSSSPCTARSSMSRRGGLKPFLLCWNKLTRTQVHCVSSARLANVVTGNE